MDIMTTEELEDALDVTGGVSVVWGEFSSVGHLEVVPVEAFDGIAQVVQDSPSVVVPRARFPGIRGGVLILVDGEEREVVKLVPHDQDGALIRLLLSEA